MQEHEKKKRKRVFWFLLIVLLFWFIWQKCEKPVKKTTTTGLLSAPVEIPEMEIDLIRISVINDDDIVIDNESDFPVGTIFTLYSENGIPLQSITKTD